MNEKLRLELPMLLPDVDDPADACIDRLVNNLTARDGVVSAHVIGAQDAEPAKLCVHFNSDLLSLQRIREIARTAGAQITDKYGHLRWNVEGLSNQRRTST